MCEWNHNTLSYYILLCPILSYVSLCNMALSYAILWYLMLSGVILPCLISRYPILSRQIKRQIKRHQSPYAVT